MIAEAQDQEVAVMLFDVVLGYGAHPDPAAELAPVINQVRHISPQLSMICSITGTEQDPQNKSHVQKALQEAGVIVLTSNAAACELVAKIISLKNL